MNRREAIHYLALTSVAVSAPKAFAQTLREVPIGLSSTSFAAAPALLARDMGLFEKNGIKPRIVVLESAAAAMTALISGSIEFVLAGPGELVTANARGQKAVLVSTLYGGLSTSVVLSKAAVAKVGVSPDAPAAARLKALDNLLIATPSPTSAVTAALRGAARTQNATVRFTYMAQPAMIAALASGAIEGYIASAPFWAIPITRGTGVLWLSPSKNDVPKEVTPSHAISVQALRPFVDANPALGKQFRAVFSDFLKAIDERPTEVKAAVAKLYPDLDTATIDLLMTTESLAWKYRPMTPDDMRHDINFMKAGGVPLPDIDKVDPASMLLP